MSAITDHPKQARDLKVLADFAQFILEYHYDEFLKLSFEQLLHLNVSMFNFMTTEEAEKNLNASNTELLLYLGNNNRQAHIKKEIERWKALWKSNRNESVKEDITLIAHSRKQAFLKFLPLYHDSDTNQLIELVKEIDLYNVEYTISSFKASTAGIYDDVKIQTQGLEESEARNKQTQAKAPNENFAYATQQNVTAQKETERKLFENQTFIQRIADAVPAIITSYNVHSGKYIFINQGLHKFLGHDPQRVLDDGISFFMSIIHPDDLSPLLKKNNEALKEANSRCGNNAETIVEFQYRMRHINGEYKWFHTFGTVFQRNQQGEIQHVLNISLDITERVKAEDVLVQRTHELQQSNSSLEEFAYVASHDLKEPLRKIAVFTNRMATLRPKFAGKEQLYFEKVIKASLRMQQMIDDLLSLSLISFTSQNEECSLEKIFQEVLQTFEYKIEDLGASVTSDGLPDAFMVPAQAQQLFQNLISNSLKFVRSNVQPVVKVTHRYLTENAVAHYNLRTANRYLELQITDNGIGFEEEFQEKIFAVFQRLHHKHEYEGTGIGLAICRKIVTTYGGSITASGRTGEGATFTIIIPQ